MKSKVTLTITLLSAVVMVLAIACGTTPASPGPTQTVPAPTPTMPAATPTVPAPTPTVPLPTPTVPLPTPDSLKGEQGTNETLEQAQADLDKHRSLWEANRSDNYSFVLEPICFCPQNLLDPVKIDVADGTIASVTYVDSGEAPEHDGYGRYVTIDDLFDTIQEGIDRPAAAVDVSYDPVFGFPTEANVNYDFRKTDEEYRFTVSGYSPDGEGTNETLEQAQADLDKHRALWEASRSDNYSFVLEPICFCPQNLLDPVRINVADGKITSVTYVDSGDAPEHDGYGRYVTIDDLFDTVQEGIDRNAAEVDVSYDPVFGYPTDAAIDYYTRMADEEFRFIVSGYSSDG